MQQAPLRANLAPFQPGKTRLSQAPFRGGRAPQREPLHGKMRAVASLRPQANPKALYKPRAPRLAGQQRQQTNQRQKLMCYQAPPRHMPPAARLVLRKKASLLPSDARDAPVLYAAGQQWCKYSRIQEGLIAEASDMDGIKYVNCTEDAKNPVCNLDPRPRGWPYQAVYADGKYRLLGMGAKPADMLRSMRDGL